MYDSTDPYYSNPPGYFVTGKCGDTNRDGVVNGADTPLANMQSGMKVLDVHWAGGRNPYWDSGFTYPTAEEIIALMKARGPVIVSIDGGAYDFGWYVIDSSVPNIINDPCCGYQLNHAVLTVGWGVEEVDGKFLSYWVIRNSWGTGYGADGYVKIGITTGGRGICLN